MSAAAGKEINQVRPPHALVHFLTGVEALSPLPGQERDEVGCLGLIFLAQAAQSRNQGV